MYSESEATIMESIINEKNPEFYIKTSNLYSPYKIDGEVYLCIKGGKIEKIAFTPPEGNIDILDLSEFIVGPGFIDVHIHGFMGHDSIEGSFDAIQSMSLKLPSKGVTAFLPTTTAYFTDKLAEIISISREFERIEGAKPLGFHLEGPFLCKNEPGAMDPNLFEVPTNKKVEKLLDSGIVRMVTIAPELENALDIISFLSKRNVAVALGHTATSFEIAEKAFTLGASSITHFFNAMPQFHHRSPGLIGAGFIYPFYLQFIADGVHTHVATIKIACQIFKERLVLITDAIMAAGIEKPGVYKLGDFNIIVDETSARLPNGTLAGSILTMDKGFRNLIQFGGLSLAEAFKCASTNPAFSINELKRGEIKEGNYADFVILKPNDLSVYLTIREGKIIYANK